MYMNNKYCDEGYLPTYNKYLTVQDFLNILETVENKELPVVIYDKFMCELYGAEGALESVGYFNTGKAEYEYKECFEIY